MSPPGVARAREEIAAAALLRDHGFTAQAVSRSFDAAHHAAETALFVLGETRSEHSDVISAVVRRLVRERALDPQAGRLLRSLFNRSALADRCYDPVPPAEAAAAVADATCVVNLVAEWIDDLDRSGLRGLGRNATQLPARPARRRHG
ncbi:HEPN domain-containing protein [Pseudonocardia asaccharolytica]|uniref:HEPN domain-containing protein n=1 Tax=Pseudonocardia asaccharolytica DSM 44247 = NBRC 16224 TaxID=1123024 RepID=A0A511D8W9_9PSEU|nr:HEPN domain-containing protein [Pseudonocardia asaccharolytica]GEL19388.1 hypothetical protein PA7_32250 [Pseudonocardia asaccharolytica DSM 44247 = NBRC 16224]